MKEELEHKRIGLGTLATRLVIEGFIVFSSYILTWRKCFDSSGFATTTEFIFFMVVSYIIPSVVLLYIPKTVSFIAPELKLVTISSKTTSQLFLTIYNPLLTALHIAVSSFEFNETILLVVTTLLRYGANHASDNLENSNSTQPRFTCCQHVTGGTHLVWSKIAIL